MENQKVRPNTCSSLEDKIAEVKKLDVKFEGTDEQCIDDLKTMRNVERMLEAQEQAKEKIKEIGGAGKVVFVEREDFTDEVEAAVNPNHYKDNIFGKELIDVMRDLFSYAEIIAYCKINVFKYRMRAGKKSDSIEQDIKKALWYENKANELQQSHDDLPF